MHYYLCLLLVLSVNHNSVYYAVPISIVQLTKNFRNYVNLFNSDLSWLKSYTCMSASEVWLLNFNKIFNNLRYICKVKCFERKRKLHKL